MVNVRFVVENETNELRKSMKKTWLQVVNEGLRSFAFPKKETKKSTQKRDSQRD